MYIMLRSKILKIKYLILLALLPNKMPNITHNTKVNEGKNNYGDNILRLFDTLPNFLFTTSETKHDY